MKVLRTGVVGLGRIGWQFHLPEIRKHEGFDLAAVADPLAERLAEAKAQFGAKGYADCRDMLAREKLDLVVIASPTPFHAEQALDAFANGCDVFCDKPMAPSLTEADRIIAGMKRHGRKCMIYQPHRATAEAVSLKQLLAKDLIGPVYMMKRGCSDFRRRNDWQSFRKHGGGMLNNYGAHYIDQLLYMAGSPVKRLRCGMKTIASLGDAEDVVKAVIETENGIVLDLDINMATAFPIPPWLVLGRRGSITFDSKAKVWQVRYFRQEDLGGLHVQEGLAAEGRKYLTDEKISWREEQVPLADFKPIDYYAKCHEYFALDKPPFVAIEESRELMNVLEECRRDSDRQ